MPHMILPFGHALVAPQSDPPGWTIEAAFQHLNEAHSFLVTKALAFLANGPQKAQSADQWGTLIKRESIQFNSNELILLNNTATKHKFVEVINMCATVERMLDALKWAGSEFQNHLVAICNPTTSSNAFAGQNQALNNDLVLVCSECQHVTARFEVSDVFGKGYGKRKERKDLKSLGVDGNAGDWQSNERKFLVVSKEFGAFLGRRQPPWRIGIPQNPTNLVYKPFDADHETKILEIIPPGASAVEKL